LGNAVIAGGSRWVTKSIHAAMHVHSRVYISMFPSEIEFEISKKRAHGVAVQPPVGLLAQLRNALSRGGDTFALVGGQKH